MEQTTKSTSAKKSTSTEKSSWITRVNAGLKVRAGAEREIAAALAEHKKKVGTKQWLEDCEREWGWSRSTTYRHLDPKQMEAARAHTCEQRAKAPEELADAFRFVDAGARPNVGTNTDDILTKAETSRQEIEFKAEPEVEADTEEEIAEESTPKIIAALRRDVGRSVGFLERRTVTQEQIGQLMAVRDRLDAVIERLLVVAS